MSRKPPLSKRLAALGLLALGVVAPADAGAHERGLSRGDYVAHQSAASATIAFARGDAVAFFPALDVDRDGSLTEAEVTAQSEPFARHVFSGITVASDGKACTPKPAGARLAAEDGIEAYGTFSCAAPVEGTALDVAVPLLDTLATGHRHLLKLSHDGKVDEAMLHRKKPSLSIAASAAPKAPAPAASDAEAPPGEGLFALGVRRLLRWDHLLFVVGLALTAGLGERRARSLALTAAAFFVAHSLTLALAALGYVHPSPRIIDALIALSVAYVGVENLIDPDPSKRWRLALLFGLAHGFGFAAALGELGLPRAQASSALARFGAGVEVGHLAVLGLAASAVVFLAKRDAFRRHGMRIASAVIVVAGLVSFVKHVAG